MKHKFTITYETDGLPICPDAIHRQLDSYMRDIRDEFGKKYYKLPGLHKISLEPCGPWFPEEQKPMRFKAPPVVWNTGLAAERARHNLRLKKKPGGRKSQATSRKPQASSAIKGTHSNGRILKIERKC